MRTKCRRVSRWLAVGGSCLALCLLVSGVAQASLVTFRFEGVTFSTIPSQLNPPIVPNAPFSGFYTFESDKVINPDLLTGSSQIGRYLITGLSINLAGKTYSLGTPTPGSFLGVIDVTNSTGPDSYAVRTTNLTGDAINGSGLVLRQLQFSYSLTDMFDSDALPLVPPPLPTGPFGRPQISLSFIGGGTGVGTGGTLTSLTAVPLPGALLLFGSGLLGLLGINVGRRMMAQTK